MSTTRFPGGTFTPSPVRAPIGRIIASQTKMEATLILRHGEQLLLTLIIPMAMLVGFTIVPVLDDPNPLQRVFPMVLSVAVMSAGFTGQAIAVGFDRRYGALKRIGASALPKWGIIVGKCCAVAIVVTLQFLLFSAVAIALGFSASVGAWLMAFIMVLVGTATFTSLGLLIGGTLGAELILGLANLIWFILLGAATLFAVGPELSSPVEFGLKLLPSVALTDVITQAFATRMAWHSLIVLVVWGIVSGVLATRLFRFEAKGD
ncbi:MULTISPECIES: ABC transporter permease [unclassified Corynebacterium]|uniref:ABC transporter permease n=1 Tax=unclassified Corynebacterium TaxID=2624378 RepID=UPI0030A567E5